MFKNGNDVTNDCYPEVHHDVFVEVHQHVLANSAAKNQKKMYINTYLCLFGKRYKTETYSFIVSRAQFMKETVTSPLVSNNI